MSRYDGVIVVFDGPDRLHWKRIAVDRWTPSGLWPSRIEAAEIQEVLDQGEPLLVILDRRSDPVHVLAEELAAAPPAVTDLIHEVEGEVAELRIPRLNWLPDRLRHRGQQFLTQTSRDSARYPALLTPPLVLDEDGDQNSVRFGIRMRPADWRPVELSAAVAHTFAGTLADSVRVS